MWLIISSENAVLPQVNLNELLWESHIQIKLNIMCAAYITDAVQTCAIQRAKFPIILKRGEAKWYLQYATLITNSAESREFPVNSRAMRHWKNDNATATDAVEPSKFKKYKKNPFWWRTLNLPIWK
jgi:hypothetical protein